MNAEQRAEAFTRAVLEQLKAETASQRYSVKSLAAAMGIDYNTFRRYLIGERPMPVPVLWAALETLQVDEAVFMRRAQDRYETR